MKRATGLRMLWLGWFLMAGTAAHAGDVTGLTSFVSGTPALASAVNGNFTVVKTAVDDNHARVAALEAEVAALKALLVGVTRETVNGHPAVRFSGVNVQVVNGGGTTAATPNGTGNVIIGYDEPQAGNVFFCSIGTEINGTPIPTSNSPTPPAACTNAGGTWAASHKSGSHYLVVGDGNNYSQYGGTVVGRSNTSNNVFASVSGGRFNRASGAYASVSVGFDNTASGRDASVSGGQTNTASGASASVSGGFNNTASGIFASVSGGQANTASGNFVSVSGGLSNIATGANASVSGGEANLASGDQASVSGGQANNASGIRSSISGGAANTASANRASVSGGSTNIASGASASVGGGQGCDSGAIDNKWIVGLQASAGCSANAN